MSDQTRHSDTRPDLGIIIIQASDDREKDALLLRIRDLVARNTDVLLAPPTLSHRHPKIDEHLSQLLTLPVLVTPPPRRRKRKWRNPAEKGRR